MSTLITIAVIVLVIGLLEGSEFLTSLGGGCLAIIIIGALTIAFIAGAFAINPIFGIIALIIVYNILKNQQ